MISEKAKLLVQRRDGPRIVPRESPLFNNKELVHSTGKPEHFQTLRDNEYNLQLS